MDAKIVWVFVLVTLFKGVYSADRCTAYAECQDGYYCCRQNTRCCPESSWSTGVIVGIAISCITFISCVVCGVVVCTKMKSKPKRNVEPTPHKGMTIMSQGQPPPYYQGQMAPYNQMHGQPSTSAPQGYANQQQSISAEKPGMSDPAYPPPPPPPANY